MEPYQRYMDELNKFIKLCQRETKEMSAIVRQFEAKKVSNEDMTVMLAIHNQILKRFQLAFKAIDLAFKYGRKFSDPLAKLNLIF